MVVSSGKTAFGQAVSHALSKVGKPEMVLKNEQPTAMQLLHCEDPTFTTSTYMQWKPIAFRRQFLAAKSSAEGLYVWKYQF